MNVAFIPVRGGSKSIPLKNIKIICGKPLVYWTAKAACECEYIDKVYISTDSDEIKEVVESFTQDCFSKIEVIGRSSETATDGASTESAMLEFADNYDFDNIFLIQATSPLLEAADLNKGYKIFDDADVDSVISCVPQYRFVWKKGEKDNVSPINYDYNDRPRRQDFEGYLVENGAFYITSKDELLKSGCRISGNIKCCEMREETAFEIDEPIDWTIVELLLKKRAYSNVNIPKIKMFLTDCDGCLTDHGMYYSENGDELKKFSARDGKGIELLRNAGIITGMITSEIVDLNKRRAEKIKLDIYEPGCIDKLTKVKELAEQYKVSLDEICYVGDDINDLECINSVGLGVCPNDAIDIVKDNADIILNEKGGRGAVREAADLVLKNS